MGAGRPDGMAPQLLTAGGDSFLQGLPVSLGQPQEEGPHGPDPRKPFPHPPALPAEVSDAVLLRHPPV